ncbi:hypothetical protein BF93_11605 [Brachybacterium phenoliresistens]|uniref:RDD domain-containing protein n=1 Tax=Brachybacterium phenoliresistens TaxID=396014 RepID=Z9JWV0_9MICO|nr:hypothetical protein [Brachybacterium phenoliresistens]EWS82262.1 hypothetical protein BF93_11605 [Brachybacterium phenoliresistens]
MTRLRPSALGLRRGRAYARDCLGYLGIAAAMVPLGVVVSRRITDPAVLRPVVTAASALPPVLAACWAARAESGPHAATWGKRRESLQVAARVPGEPPGPGGISFRRALLRSTVKIAIPWQLGHTVALGAAWGDFDTRAPATLAAAVLTYPLLGAMIGSVVLSPGLGLHDRLAATRVLDAS